MMRVIFLSCIWSLLLVSGVHAATLVVLKDLVNVRQGPSLESEVIARLNKGQRLMEIQKKEGWSEVSTVGITEITGWISAAFVGPEEELSAGEALAEGEGESEGGQKVVGRMGDVVFSEDELDSFLGLLGTSMERQVRGDFDLLQNMVREEIVRKMVIREAIMAGFDTLPSVVAYMERAKYQALADHFVSRQAEPPDDYPSRQEIMAVYEKNREKYSIAPRLHIAHIFIGLPAGAEEEHREELRKKAHRVADLARFEGSDFSSLAGEYSEHTPTLGAGGDLGWVDEESMAAGMRQVFAGMQNGSVSLPYLSEQGWHIFKLIDRQEALVRNYSDVADEIRDELRREKSKRNRERYLKTILEKYEIFLDEDILRDKVVRKEQE